ncbi:MAG: hypothetical protein MR598_03930 [Erysipelotrichaceae bacterium]|nr:hypothetical protein [Erysipelotrichaceae bacterium]
MKNRKIITIASMIIIILLCTAFTVKTFQNDTFYTIKVGESILEHGIDMKDHFSWHKLDYTYPHWLYDIITYKIYDIGGLNGIYIATILIFILIGITFYFINLKQNKSYFLSLLFSILAVIMLARFITMRAQLITYLLFLIEVFFIERLLSTNKKSYIIGLFIICILIANLHAAVWPFYFILMLPYLFEYLIAIIYDKIRNKPKLGIFINKITLEKNNNTKTLAIVFLVSLALGLLTPIGNVPYTYFIKIMQGDTMKYIEEHKPLILIQNLFVIGYLLIMLIPLIFTKVKVRLSDLAMIAGLLLMSFLSIRHIAFLAIIGMFYLCRLICNIGKINGKSALDFELPWYGIFIVTVTIIITSGFVYNINSKKEFVDETIYPVKMVDYMEENLDMKEVKLYNEYDFGSYLIYRDIPVFIDSRSDLYTKPFNHKTDIFDECMKITEHYGRIFKKYNITHILIYKDTELNQILAASPNYELVHKEGRFMLYKYIATTEEQVEENS